MALVSEVADHCCRSGVDGHVQEPLGNWGCVRHSCLPDGREPVWVRLWACCSCPPNDLIEGADDVNLRTRSSEEEGSWVLFGQRLRGWALGIQAAFAIVASAPVLDGMSHPVVDTIVTFATYSRTTYVVGLQGREVHRSRYARAVSS